MRKVAAFLFAFTALAAATAAGAQTVSVTGGQIHGAMLEKGGAVFKGIPFAAPPVGDRRWREPAPVQPWQGERDATKFGAICAQTSNFIPNAADISSEDCLFLNVWTAHWPSSAPKPVMVWIHGGGNFFGSGTEDVYDGEPLARRGVVVVTFNYRLSSFGFFSHPALTSESPNHASGNQGILDQVAALKWVHDNIAKFGGDPNNVTIFGESAGAMDVGVLMTSPLSKGLFQRAIGESGPIIWSENLVGKPHTLAQAEKRGEVLAARWNVPVDVSLARLRALSTAEIIKGEPNFFQSDSTYKLTTVLAAFPYLGVIVDGYAVPKNPAEVFAAGQEHPVGLLLGSNSRERIPFTAVPMDLSAVLDETFGALSGRARALYVGERDTLYGTPTEQWATDASFRCSSVAQLNWHSAAGNAAYGFEFGRASPGREAIGVTHAQEIPYVFGTLDRRISGGKQPPRPSNAIDVEVSTAMQQYWTNFAKTGDPNGPGLPAWPKFEPNTRGYIQFTDADPVAKEGLRRPYCDLFIENVKRLMAQ